MSRTPMLFCALMLVACGGAVHEHAHAHEYGDEHAREHEHEHGHGHGDRVPHDTMSAAEYAAHLEPADRDAWQRPVELLAAIGVREGARVADVGTGSGYFLPHLSRAVGPAGHVVAEDIRQDFVDFVRERAARDGLANVEPRLGTADDPRLEPGVYDLVLFVDTYHHVADRPVFLAHLSRALAPGGRLVIVDFREGALPVGPPPEHKIALADVEREVRAAGFVVARAHTFLPHQWALELMPRSALGAQSACDPHGPTPCAPRGERPRVVLDESLTPTEAGLPALSADGTEVALAVGDPERERASSSLLVRIVRAADGSVLVDHVVISVDEALALEGTDAPDAAMRARVQQSVADIDAVMARGSFTPLAPVTFAPQPSRAPRTAHLTASAGELAIDFDPATRTLVVRAADGHERLRTELEPGASRCGGRAVSHRPQPAAVWLDSARGVLVVRVQYTDEARCGGPQPVERVLRLVP